MDRILKRSEKLAFYEVGGVYKRMRGFTDFTMSKNPTEYTRKYVDEASERNDIVGYNPSIAFSFDRFSDDDVHTDITQISDTEAFGADAVRSIVIVDTTAEGESGFSAQKRDFSIIPDSEGKDSDTYTYSGTMKANGEIVSGYAKTDDDFLTVTFTEA